MCRIRLILCTPWHSQAESVISHQSHKLSGSCVGVGGNVVVDSFVNTRCLCCTSQPATSQSLYYLGPVPVFGFLFFSFASLIACCILLCFMTPILLSVVLFVHQFLRVTMQLLFLCSSAPLCNPIEVRSSFKGFSVLMFWFLLYVYHRHPLVQVFFYHANFPIHICHGIVLVGIAHVFYYYSPFGKQSTMNF